MSALGAAIKELAATPMAKRMALPTVLGLSFAAWLIQKTKREALNYDRSDNETDEKESPEQELKNKKNKVAVNGVFLKRLRMLLRIVIPKLAGKEGLLLLLHTSFLIARTITSIYVARLDGRIVRSIVDRNAKGFILLVALWLGVAVPATYINSMIRFLESKLSIAFRSRLVDYVYKMYMEGETYYRIGNLDTRLPNPDQCLTEDVAQFCSELAHLYSQISKPLLDTVLMTIQLIALAKGSGGGASRSGVAATKKDPLSWLPALICAVVLGGTGVLLKLSTPPFGKLIAGEAQRYGDLRAAHSRLITHAEEIAFYGGQEVESSVLRQCYNKLVKHMNLIYKTRVPYTMLEQFLMKYVWGALGLFMIAIPAFNKSQKAGVASASSSSSASDAEKVSGRTQDFITARGLLISGADAVERLMSSWKEITELAGRTARVADMISVFNDVKEGRYVKAVVGEAGTMQKQHNKFSEQNEGGEENPDKAEAEKEKELEMERARQAREEMKRVIEQGQGQVIDNSEVIKMENVPVLTPAGDVLVALPGLNFTIEPGMHLLITGPNGCGKSSLFRLIGGLWPVKGGVLHKPARKDMFYIPQRPYLSSSSLREQFGYPDTAEQMKAKGWTEEKLNEIALVVNLQHIVSRYSNGWDSVQEWRDVLSGGEKQRVAMARLFYHKPRFAILDECTSAVSIDVEGQMYTHAKKIGITLLTVTHRPTLWKYHTHLLQFDGQGGWQFSQLDNAEQRESLKDEKTKLEAQISALPDVKQRLAELCHLLGESSVHVPHSAPSSSKQQH